MANILYISDGDYGTPAGNILPLVQGQYGQSIPLEIRDLAGSVANLTGYSTITGHKRKGGSVTALVGTLTLSGTPTVAPQITWVVDEDDTGDYGNFALFLEITNGTIVYTTHPVALAITRDHAVNATAAPGLVGVTTAQKALLAVIAGLTGLVEMTAGSATGVAIQTFMRTFLTSATKIAARLNLLPDYTGNAAKVLAVNATADDVEWVAQSGGGGASDVTDLTTTTGLPAQRLRVAGAGGLEYRTTEQDLADLQDAGALATTDIGVIVQAYSAKTAAIAALTWAANSIILLTGTATASAQALAAHVVTFLQSADAAGARTAIGAGTGNGTYTDNSTIKANDGTVSSPGLAFNGEASTGWYRSGAGVVRLTLTGVNQWTFGGTNFSPASSTGPKLMNEAATSTNPVFVKSDDLTSGLGWVKTGVPVIVSDSKPTCGFAYLSGIVGSAVSAIPNGTGDVTLVLSGTFTVSDGAGNVAGGVIAATAPGANFNLYDDGGTNTCQLQVAADGSVTVIRTAGSRTYAVNLNLNWM